MGLKRPIRGSGSLPPWAMRQGRGPLPLGRRTNPPWGFSPTPGREGGVHPSLAYIRRGRGALFFTTIEFSSLSLLPLSGLPLFGVCTRLRISPPYARRRSVGIRIRIHLLSAARLVWSPEGTSGTPYACNPARCYTCGTPSSSRLCCDVFNDNVSTGK